MIQEITLRAGAYPEAPALKFAPSAMTIFVGPNNSGKSAVLREIEYWCRHGRASNLSRIVESVVIASHSHDAAVELIEEMRQPPIGGEFLTSDQVRIGGSHNSVVLTRDEAINTVVNKHNTLPNFAGWFLTNRTLRLDGPGRIALCSEQTAGNLLFSPQSTFAKLFKDDRKRNKISEIVKEGIDRYLIIDPTNLGKLSLRLSTRKPVDPGEERGLDDRSLAFHQAALPIQEASDGVKAYVGMIVELLQGDPLVALIDEPEAFLHPALSRKLGQEIAIASMSAGKRIVAATHSADFLMGCIESHAPINIVRLTYENGISTARLLPNDNIVELMRNPLLRSTNILTGIFFENIVVTESDTDRAFYQQINERLLRFDKSRGIRNCLFVNAQNKQTIETILKPLRQIGIAAAAIVDIDIVKANAGEWKAVMRSLNVPSMLEAPLSTMLNSIERSFIDSGRDMKRDGGISLLKDDAQKSAKEFWNMMSGYGLFIVAHGELESWLGYLNARGHGPYWLIETFKRMGDDPENAAYVKPGTGDVWDFLGTVRSWLVDPDRKGMH